MPRSADETRRRILDAAYELFYREGFARIGVDAIAREAGVTKRTLYYHFESKDALFAAVLDHQHAMALARIEHWAGPCGDDPLHLVETLFGALGAWAATGRWQGSGFTRMAMELAGLPGHPARAAAGRHKAAVEAYLAARLQAAGIATASALARQIMLLSEGCLSLILIHGDTGYAADAAAAARQLVASHQRETTRGQTRVANPNPVR